jgi:hypothetical protein
MALAAGIARKQRELPLDPPMLPISIPVPMTSIAAASTIQQSQVTDKIAIAVARKTLDAQAAQGQAVVDLVKQAADVQREVASSQLDTHM